MTEWKKISNHIKKLVESGRLEDARNVLSTIEPGISAELDNWHQTLSMPKAKQNPTASGGSIKEDALWLRNNSKNYKGKWIALKNGVLLGSHISRLELRRSLQQENKLDGAMFFKIEN